MQIDKSSGGKFRFIFLQNFENILTKQIDKVLS